MSGGALGISIKCPVQRLVSIDHNFEQSGLPYQRIRRCGSRLYFRALDPKGFQKTFRVSLLTIRVIGFLKNEFFPPLVGKKLHRNRAGAPLRLDDFWGLLVSKPVAGTSGSVLTSRGGINTCDNSLFQDAITRMVRYMAMRPAW